MIAMASEPSAISPANVAAVSPANISSVSPANVNTPEQLPILPIVVDSTACRDDSDEETLTPFKRMSSINAYERVLNWEEIFPGIDPSKIRKLMEDFLCALTPEDLRNCLVKHENCKIPRNFTLQLMQHRMELTAQKHEQRTTKLPLKRKKPAFESDFEISLFPDFDSNMVNIAIVGESGSGKTELLNAIAVNHLDKPRSEGRYLDLSKNLRLWEASDDQPLSKNFDFALLLVGPDHDYAKVTYEDLQMKNIPTLVVIPKADEILEKAKEAQPELRYDPYFERRRLNESREKIMKSLECPVERTFLTSNHYPYLELPEVLDNILKQFVSSSLLSQSIFDQLLDYIQNDSPSENNKILKMFDINEKQLQIVEEYSKLISEQDATMGRPEYSNGILSRTDCEQLLQEFHLDERENEFRFNPDGNCDIAFISSDSVQQKHLIKRVLTKFDLYKGLGIEEITAMYEQDGASIFALSDEISIWDLPQLTSLENSKEFIQKHNLLQFQITLVVDNSVLDQNFASALKTEGKEVYLIQTQGEPREFSNSNEIPLYKINSDLGEFHFTALLRRMRNLVRSQKNAETQTFGGGKLEMSPTTSPTELKPTPLNTATLQEESSTNLEKENSADEMQALELDMVDPLGVEVMKTSLAESAGGESDMGGETMHEDEEEVLAATPQRLYTPPAEDAKKKSDPAKFSTD